MKTPRADFAPSSGWQGSLHRTLGMESFGTLVDLNCWSKIHSSNSCQFASIMFSVLVFLVLCTFVEPDQKCSQWFGGSAWIMDSVLCSCGILTLLLQRTLSWPGFSSLDKHFTHFTFLFNWNRIVCHWNHRNQSTTRYEKPVQGPNGLFHIEGKIVNVCSIHWNPFKQLIFCGKRLNDKSSAAFLWSQPDTSAWLHSERSHSSLVANSASTWT